MTYDIAIVNASIIDGSGAPARSGDVVRERPAVTIGRIWMLRNGS
jgi:N-acyl-D-aspartate/D-glutamate deacylase